MVCYGSGISTENVYFKPLEVTYYVTYVFKRRLIEL